jgi:hypothetical protein
LKCYGDWFTIAQAFGQDPYKIIHEWPARFKNLAMAWLSEQWNNPSRTDYYLMRIAQRVQQWANPKALVKEQKVVFEQNPDKKEETDSGSRSKAVWIGGVKAAAKIRDRHGNRT